MIPLLVIHGNDDILSLDARKLVAFVYSPINNGLSVNPSSPELFDKKLSFL